MINIVTSVCVDTEIEDESVDYPMLRLKGRIQKRETYWKCATVLMSTVSRLCPNAKHFIFTNDPDSVNINGIDINSFLSNIGTEVRYLSFNEFKTPSNLSKRFKNAFYKHEVAYDLGKSQAGYSILLDSDCLWTKQENDVYPLLEKDEVLLYDVYERNSPFLKEPHNLSMADMGKLFKEIDSKYSTDFPIWFGSEIIGGNQENLRFVSQKLKDFFVEIVKRSAHESLLFENGFSIFDNDEFVCSFVYNNEPIRRQEARGLIKRVWTIEKPNNVMETDLNIPVWHLPSEKETGIHQLFCEATGHDSNFWRISIDEFNRYLGSFVGIPKRSYDSRNINSMNFFKKAKRLLSKLVVSN